MFPKFREPTADVVPERIFLLLLTKTLTLKTTSHKNDSSVDVHSYALTVMNVLSFL